MFIRFLTRFLECLPKKLAKKIANIFFNNLIQRYAQIEVTGYENLAAITGPILFISNHLSNADGLVLNRVLEKEEVTFVSGVKLSENTFTRLGIIALNTTPIIPNSSDKSGIEKVIKIMKSGHHVLIFPEGTRSRTKSMIEGKKGILLIRRFVKATVVPIGITGTERLLPINDSDMAKEKFHKEKVTVSFGQPILLPEKAVDESRKDYEDRLLPILMYSIAALLPMQYRGVYSNPDDVKASSDILSIP